MSPYKSFIAATKNYFHSVAFLKFLLAASIFIFAAGGLFYLLGLFITSVYEAFVCLGSILIWAGLLLSIIKEDVLTIAISSGTIALGSLVGWIVKLAGGGIGFGGFFAFSPFLFFLIFGAISVVVFVKADKFKQMRAASAAARPQGMPCQRCGNFVPFGSGFCPACGAPAPQYAPPQPPPQYAPPQYAAPQYAPPQPPPYAAPMPPVAPAPPVVPAEPVKEASATKPCVNCGAQLPADASFCGKCGTKQG